jgi:4-hydroxy 2-oxovalerate aldolase
MKTIQKILNTEKGKNALIVGAGASINSHKDKIEAFIEDKIDITFGINNMTSFIVPDYHVWTNRQRLLDFGDNIHKESKVMFGRNIPEKIRRKYSNDYVLIKYTDNEKEQMSFKNGVIRGYYRTAGCLSIMIAHLLGCKNIYIVGMDGYTYYFNNKDDMNGQHLYGSGLTDKNNFSECKKKDDIVLNTLTYLWFYGINFNIITPTVFKDFYKEML